MPNSGPPLTVSPPLILPHLRTIRVVGSGCTPRRLIFYTYDPAFERIYRCMTVTPWVRALEMAYIAGNAADYHLVFENLEQGSILPALESLQITDCAPEIALPTLARMLKARTTDTEGLAKLQSFSLLFEDGGDYEAAGARCAGARRVGHAP
ncbi:hypothetical protein C8R47DRAFT_1136425 [Mycena vitilis]|nr:hypothetical protein C8R47DRAFT_1136425 [Mycena vitilis]